MTSPEAGPARRWAMAPGAAALAAALVFMVLVSVRALREHYTLPTIDDWRILDGFLTQPFGTWLVESQNGHRMPATQMLLAVDYVMLGGHMHLLVAASLVCAWLAFAVACRSWRFVARRPAWLLVLAFTGYALFWAGGAYDFAWGTNQGSQQAVLLLFVALLLLATVQQRRLAGRPPAWGLVAGMVLAAAGTTFSHGIGLAVWGTLAGVAIAARLPWRILAAVALAALVTGALYAVGLRTGYGLPVYVKIVTEWWLGVLAFVAGFVGIAPNVVAAGLMKTEVAKVHVGLYAGAGGLAALAAWAVSLLVRRTKMAPTDVVALGLMTFAAVGGLATAMNRIVFGLAGQERLVTWSTLFWIGAVWAAGEVVTRSRSGTAVFGVALVAAALGMWPALRAAWLTHSATGRTLALNAEALVLGIRSDGVVRLSPIVAHDDVIYRVTDRMQTDRRGPFADPMAALPGTPLAAHFVPAAPDRCRGYVFKVDRLTTHGAPAVQMHGHWDTTDAEALTRVVITDGDGTIRGLGMPEASWETRPADRPWRLTGYFLAYVADPQPAERYVVYGILGDGRSACVLATQSGAEALAAPLLPVS